MLRFVGGSRFTQPDPIQGGCANLYTYGFGDPLNSPDLSGETDTEDPGGACIEKKHSSFWSDLGTGLSWAAVAVGAVALLPEEIPGAAAAAIVLAGAAVTIDLDQCLAGHHAINCSDASLGVAGGVGGFASLGGTLARLSAAREDVPPSVEVRRWPLR